MYKFSLALIIQLYVLVNVHLMNLSISIPQYNAQLIYNVHIHGNIQCNTIFKSTWVIIIYTK